MLAQEAAARLDRELALLHDQLAAARERLLALRRAARSRAPDYLRAYA